MPEMNDLIATTVDYVKNELKGAEKGHDWSHTYRVWQNAKKIAEGADVDLLIVELAAILHDLADAKFHAGDEEVGPKKARTFLLSLGLEESKITHIENIIRHMSFKNSLENKTFHTPEMDIVQDADRLDAIGAIGIARAFHYGGFKNRPLYDPNIPPIQHQTKQTYKQSTAPTINHFYEKLLHLKDLMNTSKAREMAENRHRFMVSYLDQFYKEWT